MRVRTRSLGSLVIAIGVLWLLAAIPAFAIEPPDEEVALEEAQATEPYEPAPVADPHDPLRAMHPVRVAAYALHPVGVAIDWVIVRPAVWVARQEPFRTIFGYQD
jgi:hypothetical protein